MSLLTDVESLKEMPQLHGREDIASKVAGYFNQGVFTSSETNIAIDIIRLLAKDVEVRVRQTLAEHLKSSTQLPRDVALRLANDVLEVSAPILEFSNVLTESDLVAIIKSTQQVAKLIPVSRRANISEIISGELIATKHEEVVVSLFANKTANLNNNSLEMALNIFRNNGMVVESLINRGDLSLRIIEKIINAISIELRFELAGKYNLDTIKAQALMRDTEAQARHSLRNPTPGSVPVLPGVENGKIINAEIFVNYLFHEGLLSDSLILRSLCEGNLLFFEIGMSRRSGIPVMNIRLLLEDGNEAALRSLWKRANLPESSFNIASVIIKFACQHRKNQQPDDLYQHNLVTYLQDPRMQKISLLHYYIGLACSNLSIADMVVHPR